MQHRVLKLAALGVALTLPGLASAFTAYDTFGALPAANWGGVGIPNDAATAAQQIIDGSTTITIAMTAHERYFNAPVGDDGAGTYFAGTGQNCGVTTDPVGCPSASQGALWNWAYYLDISGPGVLADYQIDIWYDLEAGPARALGDLSGMGRINVTAYLLATAPATTNAQDSQNNLFGFLAVDNLPFVDAPATAFDPNATGFYQYAITVSKGGFPLDSVAMQVQVVPVPAAAWLFGSALGLLAWVRRRTA